MTTKTALTPTQASQRYERAKARYEDALAHIQAAQTSFSSARKALTKSRREYFNATMPDDVSQLTKDQLATLLSDYTTSDSSPDDAWTRINAWTASFTKEVMAEGYDYKTGLPCVKIVLNRDQDITAVNAAIDSIAALLPLSVEDWPERDPDILVAPRQLIIDPLEHTLSEGGSYMILADRDEDGTIIAARAQKTTYGRTEVLLEGDLEEVLKFAAKRLYYEDPSGGDDEDTSW
jgi:hypothetical protein